MQPGVACRACHLTTEPGKAYFFMGTAYASPHQADLCASDSTLTGAVVEILDTNDVVQLTLPINAAGNFRSLKTAANVPVPYKARVKAGGKTSAMAAAQTVTAYSANGATRYERRAPSAASLPDTAASALTQSWKGEPCLKARRAA